MNSQENKQYCPQVKRGIKGEAFFESLICEHAIPHRVEGLKDIGIDYICEWANGTNPTGLLFAVQVKTFSKETAEPVLVGKGKYNDLQEYKIANDKLNIEDRTRNYWKGFGIPVYLFAICYYEPEDLRCFYKRYTPVVMGNTGNYNHKEEFYEVSRGHKFLAYTDEDAQERGFIRDLFIDYIRCNYFKGSIAYLDPEYIGLKGYPTKNIFPDLFEDYMNQIMDTFLVLKEYIEKDTKLLMKMNTRRNVLSGGGNILTEWGSCATLGITKQNEIKKI